MQRILGLGLLLLYASPTPSDGCTMIAVGREATADGSIMVAHTDDSGKGTSDVRVVRVPPMEHPPGSKRPVYKFAEGYPRLVSKDRGPGYAPVHGQEVFKPLGYIPQVPRTYGYWDKNYGLVNEVGLAIAETTGSARTIGWPLGVPGGYNMFDIVELSKVALERCESARCAVQTMGKLAVQYGFYTDEPGTPARPGYEGAGEIVSIGDKNGEAWVFHVLTGEGNKSAAWAAQRVPNGHIAASANCFSIRQLDLSDTENFMASHNVMSLAKDNGWWDPKDGEFDFAAAYAVSTPFPLSPLYTGRRMWRIYDLVAPSLKLDPYLGYTPALKDRPQYPFSVKPDQKVTARYLMRILRDTYNGTEFDQSQGPAAGPFGNPVRWSGSNGVNGGWERTISVFRAAYSFVTQIRSKASLPHALSAVMWYGHDAPHGTVYVPIYGGQGSLPDSYMAGCMSKFSPDSAWWAFNFVNNWAYLMYSKVNVDRTAEQQRWEDAGEELIKKLDAAGVEHPHMKTHERVQYAEEHARQFAKQVIESWWAFAWKVVGKFNNGYIVTGETADEMAIPGYPAWWLKTVGFDTWPGATFKYPDEDPTAVRKDVRPTHPQQSQQSSGLVMNIALVLFGAVGAVGAMRWAEDRRADQYAPLH